MSSSFYMTTSFCNIVLETPTIGHGVSLMTQTINCAIGIASIPFILSGISGVKYEIETHLRVYFYWFSLTCLFDSVCLIWMLVRRTCAVIPSILREEGGAWACGSMRMIAIAFVTLFLIFEWYCMYVIWCRCQELKDKGSEPCFNDIIGDRVSSKVTYKGGGLFGTGAIKRAPEYVSYGSLSSPLFAGSVPIFGGQVHHTSYPPPPCSTSIA